MTQGSPTTGELVAARLRHAITTASNDDYSDAGSDKRTRHVERIVAMIEAADCLEASATLERELEEARRQIHVRDTIDNALRADNQAFWKSLLVARSDDTPEGKVSRQAILLTEQAHRIRGLRNQIRHLLRHADRYTTRWPFTYQGMVKQNVINYNKFTASQAEVERLRSLVETAFRDGLTYGTNVVVTDADEAWRTSRARAALHPQVKP